jgi:hypothetical protein
VDLASIGRYQRRFRVLRRNTKLDYEVARQILRFDFTALFAPQPEERAFVIAHNDPGVRATDEVPPISGLNPDLAWAR